MEKRRSIVTKIVLSIFFILAVPARADNFSVWLAQFRQEAARKGIGAQTLAALDGIVPDDKVIRLDQSQPEHVITFAEYQKTILSPQRIARGRELLAAPAALLKRTARATGVPAKYLVALWGIESNYGGIGGNYSVLQSLATLAYEGRRAAFFRGELLSALRIIDGDHIAPDMLRGSWAGAMGQCQFMPSTFLHYAADGDGDGRRDIWSNLPDIFASMGNYLRAEGWRAGLGWGARVTLSRRIAGKHIGLTKGKSLAAWKKLGVKTGKNSGLSASAIYYLVQPDNASTPSYLVTANYKALMRWNRSTYFATSVGLLADRIAY